MSTPLPIPAGWYALGPVTRLTSEQRFCGRTLLLANGGATFRESGRAVPLRQRGGLLLAWYHPDDAAPAWEPETLDDDGWTDMTFTSEELTVHPLLVMRDLADIAHFRTVHRYTDVEVRRPLTARGPRLDTAVAFGWDIGIPGVDRGFPASFEALVEGPGYQRTDVKVGAGQWESRHLVLPTPLGDGRCRVHLGVCIRLTGALGRMEKVLGTWAMAPIRGALHAFLARMFVRDVARDARMWVHLPQVVDAREPENETFALFCAWGAQFLAGPTGSAFRPTLAAPTEG